MSPLLLTTTAWPEQPRPVFADPLPPPAVLQDCLSVYLSTLAPLPVRPRLHQPIGDEPQVASRTQADRAYRRCGFDAGAGERCWSQSSHPHQTDRAHCSELRIASPLAPSPPQGRSDPHYQTCSLSFSAGVPGEAKARGRSGEARW